MDWDDLSFCYCFDCENYFFIYEMPLGINDPEFCPYCGVEFETVINEEINGKVM